jgi:hypothetical protein
MIDLVIRRSVPGFSVSNLERFGTGDSGSFFDLHTTRTRSFTMRMVRWLASGLALVALAPSASSAQGGRLFNDSWFWGLNAGAMSFSTATVANQTAPVVNAEWFITRTKGGLYLSVGQAFFTTSAAVTDNNGTPYNVQIKDMTQVMADVIALPIAWGGVHLYAGGGFIMNLAHEATITDTILNPNVKDQVQHNLNEQKDGIQFNLLVGVHAQLKRVAIFGNFIYMPTPSQFILNGRAAYLLEGGVRLNFGPSADSGH